MTKSASRRSAPSESSEAEEMMRRDARPPSQDALEKLRDAARVMRDLDQQIADKKEELKQLNIRYNKLEFEELPSLFMQVGVRSVGLSAEGNSPAYDATLSPFYRASINAKWEAERQERALALIEKMGLGDLIKTTFDVQIGMKQSKLAKAVRAALTKLRVEFEERRTVPWNSLTAAVKERYDKGRPLSDSDLETLGAKVGNIVTLKRRD